MADVFISYSRANIDFARRLNHELHANRYDVWIDLEGIRFTADWWEEIKRGIETCTNFLLVMSAQSLSSPVCHLEIEYARKLNKRIILLAHEPFNKPEVSRAMLDRLATDAYVNTLLGDRNPMTLFDNNWYLIDKFQRVQFTYDAGKGTKFRLGESETDVERIARETEEEHFLKQFAALRQNAIDVDLEHANFHTRMVLRTRDWHTSTENESFLLFGDELAQAEKWLSNYETDVLLREKAGQPTKLPKPSDDHRLYIQASRAAETVRTTRLRNVRRASLIGAAVAVIALIFAIGASLIGLQATSTAYEASTQVAAANDILTDIPPTLTEVNQQVIVANSTLTAVPPTLNAIASEVAQANARFESLRLAGFSVDELRNNEPNAMTATLLGIRALNTGYTSQGDSALFEG